MNEQRKILEEMMGELDEIADQIPEGFYLKMCDCAKRMHATIPSGPPPRSTSTYLARRRCGVCRQLGHDRRTCPGTMELVPLAPTEIRRRRDPIRGGGCFPVWLCFW